MCRVSSRSVKVFVLVLRDTSGSCSSGNCLLAALDQLDLFSVVLDRPVSTGLSNDINLLEQRTLVPLETDLRNLAGRVEENEMGLYSIEVSAWQ
jgi:hypothetical protein